jgi:hypothetical protein
VPCRRADHVPLDFPLPLERVELVLEVPPHALDGFARAIELLVARVLRVGVLPGSDPAPRSWHAPIGPTSAWVGRLVEH